MVGVGSGQGKKGSPPESVEEAGNQAGSAKILNCPSLRWDSASSAAIEWRLDPSTFANALSRQNTYIVSTAKRPAVLRVAILFDIDSLPFVPGNFALPNDQNFWNYPDYKDTMNDAPRGRVDPVTKDFSSSIHLVPNNSSAVGYDYDPAQVYETLFLDSFGEKSPGLRCIVFQFKPRVETQ